MGMQCEGVAGAGDRETVQQHALHDVGLFEVPIQNSVIQERQSDDRKDMHLELSIGIQS